jgi:murein DD-endopeptidase MepM/ murein hydrolase activator NlpD
MRIVASLALLWGLLVYSMPARAKHVYSWRDEQGVLHFSDQKPASQKEVKSERVRTEPRTWVFHRSEQLPKLTEHYLRNTYAGPIEVEVGLTKQENTLTDPALPLRITIPGNSELLLFRASALLVPGRYAYEFQHRYVPGDPSAKPSENFVYELPFDADLSFRVTQGFGGKFSHSDEYSFHAIDIDMPVGTAVRAARAGIVMEMEQDFYDTGTNIARFGDRANYIRIVHDDGSMAVYAHLDLESARVSVGERVRVGEIIGASGNIGFSTGPHLHFVVQRNTGMRVVSIPFLFASPSGPSQPQEGAWLGAAP